MRLRLMRHLHRCRKAAQCRANDTEAFMRFDEYRRYDAVGLAALIAKGEVGAKEVLEAAIARAEAVNPKVNAIVHKQYERAAAATGGGPPDGPFRGVPFLIQDLGTLDRGEPARLGSTLYKDFVAD